MADVLIEENTMTDIGKALREKLNVETKFLPSEMPTAIRSIPNDNNELKISFGMDIPNRTDYIWCKCNQPRQTNIVTHLDVDNVSVTNPFNMYNTGCYVNGAVVNNKLYIFGGTDGNCSDTVNGNITIFDLNTLERTVISDSGMVARACAGVIAYKDKIYIFGGTNVRGSSTYARNGITNICMFDTSTNTITNIDKACQYGGACKTVTIIDNKVYFYLVDTSYSIKVQTFTINDDFTITTPETICNIPILTSGMLGYVSYAAFIYDRLYCFGHYGGSSSYRSGVLYIDYLNGGTITWIVQTSSGNLSSLGYLEGGSTIAIGNYIYTILGNNIQIFDCGSNKIMNTFTVSLSGYVNWYNYGAVFGNKIYVIGADTAYNSIYSKNIIQCVSFNIATYAPNTVYIVFGNKTNKELYTNFNFDIGSISISDMADITEVVTNITPVETYEYDNGDWIQIF